MQRFLRFVVTAALVLAVFVPFAACAQEIAEYAKGIVFNDGNRNGVRDSGEQGLAGIAVSNGSLIVQTGADGAYQLPVDDDAIIFMTKPRGWMTPLDANNLHKFYYVHKPKGSPPQKYKGVAPTGPLPESVDFPLYPQDEPDRFKVLFLGDTQPSNTQAVFYLAHDIVEELVGVNAAFGVTLGDVVSNNLSLFEDVVAAQGLAGIPWRYVKGNHDTNYDGIPDHKRTYETWTRVFGPPYYSYDYGPVHFIVLNNQYYGQKGPLVAKLDFTQKSWLRRDLALVPKDQLIVLMMHIPIHWMADRADLFSLFQDRPNTFSISGHTHTLYQVFCGKTSGWEGPEPHHHLINGAACGAWWAGAPDEVGLPHSTGADGTPNGYSIITFDGTKYSIRYKAARKPADYQMNIFAPDEVPSADSGKTKVLANVFAGSERTKVEIRLGDGPWVPMTKVSQPDPFGLRTKLFEDKVTKPLPWRAAPKPGNSSHIWEALLPQNAPVGVHLIHVRATDIFGQTDTGRRVIYVR